MTRHGAPAPPAPSWPGGQRDLSIDPGRLTASIALGRLPHADQRVAPAPQQQLLQVPDRGQVPVLRRREDSLPQSPYVVLMVPPIDGFPREGHVLGSVHHRVSNLSFGSGDLGDRITSQAHLSTSAPLSRPGTGPGIQPVIQQRRPGGAIQGCAGFLSAFARRHSLLGHPVPAREFRSPHGRPTDPPPGRPGLCRGSHVPHA